MDLKEIADDYLEKGYTITLRQESDGTLELIAEKPVRASVRTPSRAASPAPVSNTQKTTAKRGKGVTMNPADVAEIKRLRKSGLTIPQISRETGWSVSTVGQRLRRKLR